MLCQVFLKGDNFRNILLVKSFSPLRKITKQMKNLKIERKNETTKIIKSSHDLTLRPFHLFIFKLEGLRQQKKLRIFLCINILSQIYSINIRFYANFIRCIKNLVNLSITFIYKYNFCGINWLYQNLNGRTFKILTNLKFTKINEDWWFFS